MAEITNILIMLLGGLQTFLWQLIIFGRPHALCFEIVDGRKVKMIIMMMSKSYIETSYSIHQVVGRLH